MRLFILISFLFSVLCVGCETTQEAAETVGRPIGAITKTVGGVTDGARSAYADEDIDNPYNR